KTRRNDERPRRLVPASACRGRGNVVQSGGFPLVSPGASPMPTAVFRTPAIIHYGAGAFRELAPTAPQLGLRHVLIVTDRGMVQRGVAGQAQRYLEEANIRATVFDGVQPDPTLTNVADGLALLRRADCDGLVAVGGGSPMDCAKAIAVRHTNAEP